MPPNEKMGSRISDLTLDSGKPLDAAKTYKVAGWASVNPQDGKPVADVFAVFLCGMKQAQPKKLNKVAIKGLGSNPGVAGCGCFLALFRFVLFAAGAFVLLVVLSVPVTAQDKPAAAPIIDKPFADHHLALHLSDNDPKKEALVLSVAYNLLKYYGPDRIAIEVVTFGPGIDLVRAGNAHRAEVDSLISQGVQFDVCMNTVETIERETGKKVDLNPRAVKVVAGVAQILALTEKGFTLVRP